jgi:hypothetical protein
MAGVGRAPKDPGDRVGHEAPIRGDWKAVPGVGWQHGEVPPCPVRTKAAQETWASWFSQWYAAHWTPADLPNLRLCIKAWARADGPEPRGTDVSGYVRLADDLGITRKGQQDRRWKPPEAPRTGSQASSPARASRATSPAAHLSVVPDEDA